MTFRLARCIAVTALAALAAVGATAAAAEPPEVEVSLRATPSTGRTAYTLHDGSGRLLVSRLSFDGLDAVDGELHLGLTHPRGFFGWIELGLGALAGGALVDEDFPVTDGEITVYSSTDSELRDGRQLRLALAAGARVLRTERARLGAFLGVRRAWERLNAHGCTQTAGSPQICSTPIPTTVRGITADLAWTSGMAGLDGQLDLGLELEVSARVALLFLTLVSGTDTHWLRTGPQAEGNSFSGPTPIEASGGVGVETEAWIRWRHPSGPLVGAGFRYAYIDAPHGLMRFDRSAYPIGGRTPGAQVLELSTSRAALLLEAGWAF